MLYVFTSHALSIVDIVLYPDILNASFLTKPNSTKVKRAQFQICDFDFGTSDV